MARLVGVFQDRSAVDAVVEQLQFNGITDLTVVAPDAAWDDASVQQLGGFGVPDEQMQEYGQRRAAQRWLLLILASALEVPTVQRALRNGQAVDIDLLPDGTS
jgi:acyl CoA:acetate/3-ketoacid CoA transferase alpha subunit